MTSGKHIAQPCGTASGLLSAQAISCLRFPSISARQNPGGVNKISLKLKKKEEVTQPFHKKSPVKSSPQSLSKGPQVIHLNLKQKYYSKYFKLLDSKTYSLFYCLSKIEGEVYLKVKGSSALKGLNRPFEFFLTNSTSSRNGEGVLNKDPIIFRIHPNDLKVTHKFETQFL